MPRLLVVGAGYLGASVARLAKSGGWAVVPVVRSADSAAGLRHEFPQVQVVDAVEASFWNKLGENWQGMVWLLSPSQGDKTSFHDLHRRGATLAASWGKRHHVPMVYLSSTSVYAEATGGWVNETSPVAVVRSMPRRPGVGSMKRLQSPWGMSGRCRWWRRKSLF
ncbi:MAG: hypothetical protein EB056_07225 [Verrucomicrobia bacterium]|nr:hypothetical protein [Verrucomicrobiota bacterium]